MPVDKATMEIEDEYDRKLSESVRIRIMIENSIFKKSSSNEFSYDSEHSASPDARQRKQSGKSGGLSPNASNSKKSSRSSS
jgi:hypothetical protein